MGHSRRLAMAPSPLIRRGNAQTILGGEVEDCRPEIGIVEAYGPIGRTLQRVRRTFIEREDDITVVRAVPHEAVNSGIQVIPAGEAGRYEPCALPYSGDAERRGLVHDGLYVALLEYGERRGAVERGIGMGQPTHCGERRHARRTDDIG